MGGNEGEGSFVNVNICVLGVVVVGICIRPLLARTRNTQPNLHFAKEVLSLLPLTGPAARSHHLIVDQQVRLDALLH